MFPVSVVCGNTMILKPSERDPGAPMLLMELMNEAGFPPGTINVIHGQHEGVWQLWALFSRRGRCKIYRGLLLCILVLT